MYSSFSEDTKRHLKNWKPQTGEMIFIKYASQRISIQEFIKLNQANKENNGNN